MTSINRAIASHGRIVLLASALSVMAAPVLAQAPERLADKDVKALLEEVDTGRDKFEGNLDGEFKSSTITNANGETKVSIALQDYQDATQKLKDRFTADYAAAAEVATVLKQSTAINAFMLRQPSSMKGRPEWDRQAVNLQKLAAVYGTAFPLADSAVARRTNDKEVAAAAAAVAAAADRFKADLDKATGVAKPDKDAAKKDIELVEKQANVVKSRVNDGSPAATDVKLLVAQVNGLQGAVDRHSLATTANWQAVQASLVKLQQAFGLTR
jgi:hypothetical protein